MRYAWIIDIDYFPEGDKFPTNRNAKNMIGPGNATVADVDSLLEILTDGSRRGSPFRMLTDDNELCYEGRIIGLHICGFEPLDDFGTPNAGCTIIQYKSPTGVWITL